MQSFTLEHIESFTLKLLDAVPQMVPQAVPQVVPENSAGTRVSTAALHMLCYRQRSV